MKIAIAERDPPIYEDGLYIVPLLHPLTKRRIL
jgi:hypothetical protein